VEIIVYGMKHCSMCRMLKQKLENKNIDFQYIEDEQVIMKLAQEVNILTAPIVKIDNNYFNLQDSAKELHL